MRLKLNQILFFSLAAAYLATAAHARAAVNLRSIDTSGYPRVRVTVVAPPASRTPRLTENGIPVVGFSAVNYGSAKSIVLALDRSQSMRGRPFRRAIGAARSFIGAAGRGDHVGVVVFGSSAVAVTRSSADPATARDQVGGLTVDGSPGTALYDAVVLAAGQLEGDNRPGRAIVVVTDGKDVSSRHTFADAVAAAHAAAAPVYTIGIAGPDFTPYALRRLAGETGGSYRVAMSAAGLAATYDALRAELARTWSLSYLTSAAPRARVKLGVRVAGAGTAAKAASMPSSSNAGTDAPSGAIPAAGYGAVGTLAIGLAVGLLLLLACFFWFAAGRGSRLNQRIEPHLGTVVKHGKARRAASRAATRARFSDLVDNALANVKQFKQVQRLIERADLPLRPGELLLLCAGCGILLGLFLSVVAQSALVAFVFTVLGASLPLGFVSFKARSRLRKFEDQLPDLLITLAASLKAGHSFRQGIHSVVEEGAEPNASEFKRVLTETQLGKPMDDSLAHMAERVGSKDFTFVITAVTIQRQIGGSLAGLFDMVAETVRQRQQFSRKVRALTAMGRASAYVLIALPFFIAAVVTMLNPSYMSPLYHTPLGQELIVGSLISVALGSLMLKRIASFRG